jgi:hypothetical protein
LCGILKMVHAIDGGLIGWIFPSYSWQVMDIGQDNKMAVSFIFETAIYYCLPFVLSAIVLPF